MRAILAKGWCVVAVQVHRVVNAREQRSTATFSANPLVGVILAASEKAIKAIKTACRWQQVGAEEARVPLAHQNCAVVPAVQLLWQHDIARMLTLFGPKLSEISLRGL